MDERPLTTAQKTDEWNLRVKTLEEQIGYPICGAKGKRKLSPCTNKAGKGTDHLGSGRCKYHGGGSQSPLAKNWKHGMYSKIRTEHPALREKMEELALAHDVFDLREEILRMRAIIDYMATSSNFDEVIRYTGDMSKVIERLHNIEVGRRLVISIENVYPIIDNVILIINRHIPDATTRHLIAEDLKQIRISTALPSAKEAEAIDAEWEEVKQHAGSTESN
jgi:hypothetical protein